MQAALEGENMSIYATTLFLGDECDKRRLTKPIQYQGSQVLPRDRDKRGGSVDLGAIPSHITRDGRDDALEGRWHPWLRISVNESTVVLTRDQVKMLRDSLAEWLEASA